METNSTPAKPQLTTWVTLLATASLVDASLHWHDSPYDFFLLGFCALIQLGILNRYAVPLTACFLVVSTAVIASGVPDLDNNLMVTLFFHIPLLCAIAFEVILNFRRLDGEEVFQSLKPLLRYLVAIIYCFAGFHKLNSDFLNPSVSCSRWALETIGRTYLGHSVALGPGMVRLASMGALILELGGGLLLFIETLQTTGVCLVLAIHFTVCLLDFTDFAAIMVAGLFAFVSEDFWTWLSQDGQWDRKAGVPKLVSVYAGIQIAVALMMVFTRFFSLSYRRIFIARALIYLAGLAALAWGAIRFRTTGRGPVCGASMSRNQFHAHQWAFVGLLAYQGMTPYLGLGTTGTFSMFSNLTTENGRSNHLLIGPGALRFWPLQDDIVWIRTIDPRVQYDYARQSSREPLSGQGLPAIEFRKAVRKWRLRGLRHIQVEYTYHGTNFVSRDITRDPAWNFPERSLAMEALSFRPVQQDGSANRCRW